MVLRRLHLANKKQTDIVTNRVAEFLESSKETIDQWRHVEGNMNHADIGSHGVTIEALKRAIGSYFRCGSASQKMLGLGRLKNCVQEGHEPVPEAVLMEKLFDWEKFSTFKKMIRLLSYCLRWREKNPQEFLTLKYSMQQSWRF